MIYRLNLIFWLLLLKIGINDSFTQTNSQKDSLRNVFNKVKKDTNTVWALLTYGRIMSNESVDSASFYYQKGLLMSKKLKFSRGISGYYANKIYLEGTRKKQKTLGISLAKEYEAFAIKEKSDYFLAKSYFSHAVVYQAAHVMDSAIVYYEKAINAYKKVNDLSEMAVIYLNISSIYLNQKLYDLALHYSHKALRADEALKDTLGMISDHANLSIIYYEKHDYQKEEIHIRESLRLSEKIKSPYNIMMGCTNLGEMFNDKNRPDSSLFYYQKAYNLSKTYGADITKIEILIGIVQGYIKTKEYTKAAKFLKIAEENKAISDLNLEKKILLTNNKIKLFTITARYKEAALLLSDYTKLTDSSFVMATQDRVLEFDSKLKKAEGEKELLAKEVKIQEQKTWIYVLGILGASLLILGFLYFRYQNKKQIAKNQTIKLLVQENEFVAIKSSLEGQLNERVRISKEIHDDLGSSLTTISLLTEILKTKVDGKTVPEVEKISATSDKMVDAMNEIVWSLNNQNDTLISLVAFIRKYARDFLQNTPIKLVFEENIQSDINLQGNVRRNIYLVVKEAINNAVKHANAQELSLNIIANDTKLIINIDDNGKGFNNNATSLAGNGLKNMKQRMENIGGTFQIKSLEGTQISIEYGLF